MSDVDVRVADPVQLPSAPNPAIADTVAWAFALCPIPMSIIGSIIDVAYSPSTAVMQSGYMAVFIMLRESDKNNFRARNVEPPSIWWVGLAPGYLWRRATILRQSRIHFWIMLAAMVAGGLVSLMMYPE